MATDIWALERIYLARRDDLIKYAASRLKNPDRAEEVVQEAFCQALLPLKGPRNPRALYTWLNGMVRGEIAKANNKDSHEGELYDTDEYPSNHKQKCGGGYRKLALPIGWPQHKK